MVQVLSFLGTAVFFIVWLYRSRKNVNAFDAQTLHYSEGWSIGARFIHVIPFQITKEVFQASDPNLQPGANWKRSAGSAAATVRCPYCAEEIGPGPLR